MHIIAEKAYFPLCVTCTSLLKKLITLPCVNNFVSVIFPLKFIIGKGKQGLTNNWV